MQQVSVLVIYSQQLTDSSVKDSKGAISQGHQHNSFHVSANRKEDFRTLQQECRRDHRILN